MVLKQYVIVHLILLFLKINLLFRFRQTNTQEQKRISLIIKTFYDTYCRQRLNKNSLGIY